HAPAEACDQLAHAGVVAREHVVADGLPAPGALGATLARGALARDPELAQILGEVIGRELGRDVDVDLADALLGRVELGVGEIARRGAHEAHAILEAQEERAPAIVRRGAVLLDRARSARRARDVAERDEVVRVRSRPADHGAERAVAVDLVVAAVETWTRA